MKQRLKSYKFWVALSAALIIFVKALGQAFSFDIDEKIIDGIVMGFCGVLVVLGFVNKDVPDTNENEQDKDDENKDTKK